IANQSYSSLNVKAPLIIIANYTLDCVKLDAFELKNNRLYELQMAIRSRYKNFNIETSRHLDDLRLEYRPVEVDAAHYYENPVLNEILQEHQTALQDKDALVVMPVGGFDFI